MEGDTVKVNILAINEEPTEEQRKLTEESLERVLRFFGRAVHADTRKADSSYREMYVSFDPATTIVIMTEAKRQKVSMAAIIRGLVRAGLRNVYTK